MCQTFLSVYIAKAGGICYDVFRGEMMLKNRALQRKRIALYLAVMLMFCAFCADVTSAGERACFANEGHQESGLGQPRAGEFFTGSLPDGERQSVREASGEWQIAPAVRSGRANGFRSGPKGTGVCIAQLVDLCRRTVAGELPVRETDLAITRCRDIIMCYIHNQDGAKG